MTMAAATKNQEQTDALPTSVGVGATTSETPAGFEPPRMPTFRSPNVVPRRPASGRSVPAAAETPTRNTAPGAKRSPLANRPKRKFLVGSVILALLGITGYNVWESLVRYDGYGLVDGRVIEISAPWTGTVKAVHAREGEAVVQGQLLVTLTNFELEQRVARLGDELKMAQAQLEAEISRSHWESQQRGDLSKKATAEYYEMWGKLLNERATLACLEANLERVHGLRKRHPKTVPDEQFDSVHYAVVGQRKNVEKLETAVEEMRQRAALTDTPKDEISKQFRPQLVRIESLQLELARLRSQIEQGHVRSPINGRVIHLRRFTGETSDPSQSLVEVLEDHSLEVVVFVPQDQVNRIRQGDQLNVAVVPSKTPVTCTVDRVGQRYESPPPNLQRYFRAQQKLLPVYLDLEGAEAASLRLGSEVRLPRKWFNG